MLSSPSTSKWYQLRNRHNILCSSYKLKVCASKWKIKFRINKIFHKFLLSASPLSLLRKYSFFTNLTNLNLINTWDNRESWFSISSLITMHSWHDEYIPSQSTTKFKLACARVSKLFSWEFSPDTCTGIVFEVKMKLGKTREMYNMVWGRSVHESCVFSAKNKSFRLQRILSKETRSL